MLRLWKICNKNKKASTKGTPSVKYSLVFPTPPVLNIRYVSAQPRYVTGMFPPPLHDTIAIRMVGCRHGNTVMLPFVCWMKWPIARSDRGRHTGYDWAVAASIVLATSRSGGWQAGGDGSSLRQRAMETGSKAKVLLLFRAGTQSTTLWESPPTLLGRLSIFESFILAWTHPQQVNKRKAEDSDMYHRDWLFLGLSANILRMNIRDFLAILVTTKYLEQNAAPEPGT